MTFARSAPGAQSAPDCSVSGCARPAECSGLCAMHRKRAQRGTDPGKPVQQKLSPWGRLFEAFTQMLEAETAAEDDADFARLEARAYKAAQRWAEHGCPLPASMQLADSVPRVVDAGGRGSGDSGQSGSKAAASVRQGQIRQPGRDAEVGARDARIGRQPRADGDRATRAVDSAEKAPERRVRRGAGAARPRGVETDQLRAGSRRGAR